MAISLALLDGLIISDIILIQSIKPYNYLIHEHDMSTTPVCYHGLSFFLRHRHSSCAAAQ